MSCWIKCLCRVYECLGAMLPAVWGGIGVCVQLGARRPAPALMVSDQSRLKHKTWGFMLCFSYSRCCLTQGSLSECFVVVDIPWGRGCGSVMGLLCCSPQVTCVGSPGALPEGGRSLGQGVQHLRLFCLWYGMMYFLYKIQHIFKYLQIGDKCG